MESDAIRIALNKMNFAGTGEKVLTPRLGTGGDFDGIFLWDTAFTAMWAKYAIKELHVERSLDNLYRLQDADGFICRQYTVDGEPVWPKHHPISFAPPVLTWAELDLYSLTGDKGRLYRVYPYLKKHHYFCMNYFSRKDGLFIGDPWGSGMDNLPRWPREFTGSNDCMILRKKEIHPSVLNWFHEKVDKSPGSMWNEQARYIDMSAQMAFNADCLSKMATLLEAPTDARLFSREHAAIGDVINEYCWNDKHQFYFDLGNGVQVQRLHIGAYWTLLAGIVPKDRLEGLLSHLADPNKFARPVPVPSLAYDDPDYRPDGGYWLGSSWPPTTYMVLRGLRAAGAEDLALDMAVKYHRAVRTVFDNTGTFWENLAAETPVPGSPAMRDFCGWSGLGAVAIEREFINKQYS